MIINFTVDELQAAGLTIESPIEDHIRVITNKIYKQPFPGEELVPGKIARTIHGGQHITITSAYTTVFMNIRRFLGDTESFSVTTQELKLLQLCMALHDSGREQDGEDLWDLDSGINCFNYLTALGVDSTTALHCGETIANKDVAQNEQKEGYPFQQLSLNEQNQPVWTHLTINPDDFTQDLFIKNTHDSDCLDIIRARYRFILTYLMLYKDIVRNKHQVKTGHETQIIINARTLLGKLIREAISITYLQGNGINKKDMKRKKEYEFSEHIYAKTTEDFANYPILNAFYNKNHLCSDTQLEAITTTLQTLPVFRDNVPESELTLSDKLFRGRVFARSIGNPSAQDPSSKLTSIEYELNQLEHVNEPSGANTSNAREGYLNASFSLIGCGTDVIGCAGFLLIDPPLKTIQSVTNENSMSGRGVKFHRRSHTLVAGDINKSLEKLRKRMRYGYLKQAEQHERSGKNHTECLIDVSHYNAIYYTQDSCHYERILRTNIHPHSPYLQAYYMQCEYFKKTGILLPIYEYSAVHDFIEERKFSYEETVQFWQEICEDYITKILSTNTSYSALKEIDLDTLKIMALYRTKKTIRKDADLFAQIPMPLAMAEEVDHYVKHIISRQLHEFQTTKIWELLHVQKNFIFQKDCYTCLLDTPIEQLTVEQSDLLKNKLLAAIDSDEFCKIDKGSTGAYKLLKVAQHMGFADLEDTIRINAGIKLGLSAQKYKGNSYDLGQVVKLTTAAQEEFALNLNSILIEKISNYIEYQRTSQNIDGPNASPFVSSEFYVALKFLKKDQFEPVRTASMDKLAPLFLELINLYQHWITTHPLGERETAFLVNMLQFTRKLPDFNRDIIIKLEEMAIHLLSQAKTYTPTQLEKLLPLLPSLLSTEEDVLTMIQKLPAEINKGVLTTYIEAVLPEQFTSYVVNLKEIVPAQLWTNKVQLAVANLPYWNKALAQIERMPIDRILKIINEISKLNLPGVLSDKHIQALLNKLKIKTGEGLQFELQLRPPIEILESWQASRHREEIKEASEQNIVSTSKEAKQYMFFQEVMEEDTNNEPTKTPGKNP